MYLTQPLHRMMQQSPDALLTVFGDRRRTVRESVDRIARLAGAVRALGVRRADRVAFLGLNSDRYHEYLLAMPWAQAAVNPVNIRWSAGEIAYSLMDSGTRVMLVDDAFAAAVPTIREAGAALSTVIYCGDGPCPSGMLDYEELIAGAAPITDPRCGGDELYGIFYTGGTTGHPKGVMLSHNNMMSSALGNLASCNRYLTERGTSLVAAPLFHLAGISMWIGAGLSACTHVILPMYSPGGVAKAISEHRVTFTVLVPTMIQMLVDDPHTADFDLSSLRFIGYGASPVPEALLERARKTIPNAGFGQVYGMTELAGCATFLSPSDHTHSATRRSAGRAQPHVELRIVDGDNNEVARGEPGEITVRGDNVMLGYWNLPDETASAVRDGWMHTGDIGWMDEAGYLFIVDRLKDMIITGGENVYSTEVENALAGHAAVTAAAVIGLPDDRWGERVHAVVVLRPDTRVTEDALRAHCRGLVAGYKVPRSIEFVAELPLSGAGKVLKRELHNRYRGAAPR